MTAIFGTDTEFSSIAGDFYSLNIDNSDNIWGTGWGITQGPPINYGDFVHTMKATDGMENNFTALESYQTLRESNEAALRKTKPTLQPEYTTIYKTLKMFPQISEFTKLVDLAKLDSMLDSVTTNNKYTIIVPTNEALYEAQLTWLHMNDPKMIRELLKGHMLNFELPFERMIERKLEVYTMKEGFSFIADGSGRYSDKINFYQKPYYMKEYMYPIPLQRYEIVKIFSTDNGMIYVMNGVFSPETLI